MAPLSRLLSLAALTASCTNAIDVRMGVSLIDHIENQASSPLFKRDDTDLSLLYPAHNFSVPVDHFHNETKYEPHCNDTFNLRYWFDASHYKAGGPVIILQSGETSGKARLPFLQKGLLAQMAEATGGIAVVLEHRYYGTSYPVPDLSTENFRFLTTEQAMADEAYFASNIQFPGLEEHGDLTAKTTPYIGYGGSYAGAFNAFLRVQYPDIFWGAISSSGVTKAIDDYWQYYQAIAEYAPPDCVASHRALVSFLDGILIGKKHLSTELKTVFDMQNVTYDDDFATAITVNPIAGWQSLNWDPAVSSHKFYSYCSNITSADILYPGTESKRSAVEKLIEESDSEADVNVNSILNVIGYTNLTQVSKQVSSDKTQDQYFGDARDATHNSLTSIEEAAWKSWPYQYCTEWGFFQTGNTPPEYGLPLVSRTADLAYTSLVCRLAFNVTSRPNLQAVNKYGGYEISYPRLAIVDGEWDPWKPATPHAFDWGARNRSSTVSEPYILISEAVHHWDENGVFQNETVEGTLPPKRIVDVQKWLVETVMAWMLEWELERGSWRQDV